MNIDELISLLYCMADSLRIYKEIIDGPTCQNCEYQEVCSACPKAGQLMRFNCPLHRYKEGEK